MTRPTLQASEQGIEKAEQALARTELTREQLAIEVSCSRQTIWKFFKGQAIERYIFKAISNRLELDWEAIVAINTEALVKRMREKVQPGIQDRCGSLRVLDMNQPISLDDIYTNVNILEKITGSRRVSLGELPKLLKSDDFARFGLGRIARQQVPGMEAVERYPKLMVLGKPGSGKTTFLKYLAIHCSAGDCLNHLVPIFVTLRYFAEADRQLDLVDFILQSLSHSGLIRNQITALLAHGRALVLLDGLDEIREEEAARRTIQQIQAFSEQYHANQFVITCRIAARDYTFEQFTEVEVADFDDRQMHTFATRWFQVEPNTGRRFREQLEANPPIKELATNPLLLTLLCLEFEDSGEFPPDRAELYKRAIATLLRKWDAKRGIVRAQVYKKLSVQRKEDLLSQLALEMFRRQTHFFKQQEVEACIADYICHLSEAQNEPEALQLDSEAVLKSIESQHGLLVERAKGIYSFSHLAFEEYFVARKIVTSSDPQALQDSLHSLVSHIAEKRWREVFLLVAEMLHAADYLLRLMKQQVDELVAWDVQLQQFLAWVNERAQAVEVPYHPAAVRAFYFNLALDRYPQCAPNRYRDAKLMCSLDSRLFTLVTLGNSKALDVGLDDILSLACDRAFDPDLSRFPYAFKGAFFLACDRALELDPKLGQYLQTLKQQLPNFNVLGKFKQWWETNGLNWAKQFRDIIIEHRNISHAWNFSPEQWKTLEQYYNANKLLVDCMNSDCYLSREVRKDIEATLLLAPNQGVGTAFPITD